MKILKSCGGALLIFGILATLLIFAWYFTEAPSSRRARKTVSQILFMDDKRVLLRNESGELFTSDDLGVTWQISGDKPFQFKIANNNELWGCFGWPGIHEGPSGELWHSMDTGRSWKKVNIDLDDRNRGNVYQRLPGHLINERNDAPLLLMFDMQLRRPILSGNVSDWKPVGNPVPMSRRDHDWAFKDEEAIQYRKTIYVASGSRIYMSNDLAETWTSAEIERTFDTKLRCYKESCYALRSQLGSEGNSLFTTPVGKNDWRPLGSLDLPLVAHALEKQSSQFGSVIRFGATAIAVADEGVYVTGIVNAGSDKSWGAVLLIDQTGQMRSLNGAVYGGLWVLEISPDGTLWVGGMGAYRYHKDHWESVWDDSRRYILINFL